MKKNSQMSTLISEGKCLYCHKTFKKSGISRHLNTHLLEKTKSGKPGKSFHIKVELHPKWGVGPYFLNLWVDGNSTMEQIDSFLRSIWLECCGHMSAFKNPALRSRTGLWDFFETEELLAKGKIKEYEKQMEAANGEVPMSRKTKDALCEGLKLSYEYDFGSTTELQLTVISEFPIKAEDEIVLLSRNEPLPILCDTCGKKAATQLCGVCMGNEEAAFCDACAKKHAKTCSDFAEYAAMKVVNSPRMGVCAYEGGIIDLERDGVFKQ